MHFLYGRQQGHLVAAVQLWLFDANCKNNLSKFYFCMYVKYLVVMSKCYQFFALFCFVTKCSHAIKCIQKQSELGFVVALNAFLNASATLNHIQWIYIMNHIMILYKLGMK